MPKERELTEEVLSNIEQHLEKHGTLPDLVTPEEKVRIRKADEAKRENIIWKIETCIENSERDPLPEELELIKDIKNGRWIDDSFWGAYYMLWDARFEHYTKNDQEYRQKGIVIGYCTSYYSYHACETTEVTVYDLKDNKIFTTSGVYPSWNSEERRYNRDGKSPFEHAFEKMKEAGFTH